MPSIAAPDFFRLPRRAGYDGPAPTTGPGMAATTPLTDHRALPAVFPRLRWLALAWLCMYLPVYGATYGAWHFLFLCNLGITLTAVALIAGKPAWLSAPAVAAPAIALAWLADAGMKLVTGQFLHGGTAYMWDAALPPLVRWLSLYHLAWPLLLAACLHRHGYDRRGWRWQSLWAAAAFALGFFVAPAAENLNYVWHWPGRPAPSIPWLHAASALLVLVFAVYWPTHRMLTTLFRAPSPQRAPPC